MIVEPPMMFVVDDDLSAREGIQDLLQSVDSAPTQVERDDGQGPSKSRLEKDGGRFGRRTGPDRQSSRLSGGTILT